MPPRTTLSKTGLNDDNVIFAANQSEVARLDTQHAVLHSAMPHLVLAPIDLAAGGHRILHQATGSCAWLRDVRAAAGGNANTWMGTDIEDGYFPTEHAPDTAFHHQSMTEACPVRCQASFDLVEEYWDCASSRCFWTD